MKKYYTPDAGTKLTSSFFLQAFSNTISSIIKKRDIDFILGSILRNAAKFLNTKHGCIFLLNPSQEYFDIRIGIGDFAQMKGMKCTGDNDLLKVFLKSEKPVILNSHCRWDSRNKSIIRHKYGKMIGIPIRTDESTLGVIIISFRESKKDIISEEIKYIMAISSLAMIALDNARLFNFVHQEYSELLRIENSLRQSEDKFSKLFQLSPTLIAIISIKDQSLIDINDSMLRVLGFDKEEIIGRKMKNFQSLKTEVKEKIITLVEKRKIVNNIDVTIIAKDGEERHGFLSNQIINLNDEECMVFLVNDVTEANQLRDDLEKSKNLEALGILSGGIAHNFNNLMQSLLGNISLAKYHSSPGDKVYKILDRAEKSYTRAKELTEQLLIFAEGGLFRKETINAGAFIEKIIKANPNLIGMQIKTEIKEGIIEFEGDERQLLRCFENIIQNSIESIKDNGIIEIKVKEKIIKNPENSEREKYYEFTIKDNGAGIPRENMRKVMNPFFTTKGPSYKGLGLTIAYSILARHKGKIKIESQSGLGTTVKIYLPEKL